MSSRNSSDAEQNSHKVLQLCAQVREVLGLLLADRYNDPLLEGVSIVDVSPAPDAGRLMVTVVIDPGEDTIDAAEVVDALRALHGTFRREIAAEINRKKTPELAFQCLPTAPGDSDFPA